MIKLFLAILLSCFLSTSIISCSFLGSSSDESAQEVTEADEDFGEDEDYDPLTDEDADVAELDDAADENLFDDGDDTGDFDADLEEGFGDDDDTALANASDAIEDVTDEELLDEADTFAEVNNPSDEVDFEDEPSDEVAAETITEEEIVAENNEVVPDAPPEDVMAKEDVIASDDTADESLGDTYYDDAPKKSWVPVQKVKPAPFNKNGVLANAIYIVRDGDSIGSISQKIYGDDRKDDLYKVNTTLASRGVKVGDKVYYNSPQRPNDSDSLLTYYEDLNLSPQIYTIQSGENIRTVSQNLLGHSQSWKEVWATNPSVSNEEKGIVNDSYELRYWSEGGPAVATSLAQNDNFQNNQNQNLPVEEEYNPPPPPPVEENIPPPPPVVAKNDIPPPPPAEAFADELPPPPPPIEQAPPPPPPVAKVAPPPPPPRANVPPPPPKLAKNKNKKNLKRKAKKIASTADKDQKMMLGALAIGLLAAVLLFIIYRKKRSRRAIDFNTSTTQIE